MGQNGDAVFRDEAADRERIERRGRRFEDCEHPAIGFQSPMLVVGKSQPIPQAVRILRHHDGKGCEARCGIGIGLCADALEPPEFRYPAQEPGEKSMVGEDADGLSAVARHENLHQFVTDALARQEREAFALGPRCGQTLGVGLHLGVFRVEPEEAQDSQVVLADARMRVADETHPPRREVRDALGVVVDVSVAIERQRIDGEVAPQRIDGEVASEMNDRAASVGFHVLPQARDLEWLALDDHRDGAVIDAGRHGFQPGPSRPRVDDGRRRRGGEIDFGHRPVEKRIAHGAADDPGLLAPAVQDRHQAAKARPFQQGGGTRMVDRMSHWKCPGTRTPFSMCDGT